MLLLLEPGYVVTEPDRGHGLGDDEPEPKEGLDVLADVVERTQAQPTAIELQAEELEAVHSLARRPTSPARPQPRNTVAWLLGALGPDIAALVDTDDAAPVI